MARVLIAEDEVELATTLAEVLRSSGHDVRTAESGGTALALAREFVPDLLVSDWALAGPPDGLAFIEALRAERPGLRAILMTGYPSTRLRAWAAANPAHALLEKPFSLAEFRAAIERALALRGSA